MTTIEAIALGWIAVTLSILTALLIVAACTERRDRREAKVRHPVAQFIPRSVAIFCGPCGGLIRYQQHPQGRDDAVALHAAYECAAQLVRRDAR